MRFLGLLVCFVLVGLGSGQAADLFELSLDELMDVQVATIGPLASEKQPAAVTRITNDDIRQSGARSLEEVLEIFVPNMQVLRHHFSGPNKGIRGILKDLDDSLLLMVNGRVLNDHTFYGADSEFKNSLLDDIHHIDVIRGPGSATFGPGAIAGVIHIHTHNANTFEGQSLRLRQGAIEEFSSLEYKAGKKLKNGAGLFFYLGADYYQGADADDSPLKFSHTVLGEPAGSSIDSVNLGDDNQAFRRRPRVKAHVEYDYEDLRLWARFNSGGRAEGGNRGNFLGTGYDVPVETAYHQWVVAADWDRELSEDWVLKLHTSFDSNSRMMRREFTDSVDNPRGHREDELFFRMTGIWQASDKHQFSLGLDAAYEWFGEDIHGYPHEPAKDTPNGNPWQSYNAGIFGEHQWTITDELTAVSGIRLDKHRYTDLLISPRVSLIWVPNERDRLKLFANRSVRRLPEFDLRLEGLAGGEADEEETLTSIELRYERQQTDALSFAVSGVVSSLDVVGWNGTTNAPLGELDTFALDLEIAYETDRWRIVASHGFAQLLDLDLDPSPTHNVISAEPYGYGDDFHHWSNHITKLFVRYKASSRLHLTASAVCYWGYPGAEDYAEYNANEAGFVDNVTYTDGADDAFKENIFVNLGAEYQARENLTVRAHAHNVLGWLDEDLNKRNYLFLMGSYRSEAPSFSISLEWTF